MKRKQNLMTWCVALLSAVIFWNCPSGNSQVKTTERRTPPPGRVIAVGGCIQGRVVNEEGKGFSGVLINTTPTTSPEVTDSAGRFEICYRRKVVNEETGETAKVSLENGSYSISFNKDGFHARPVNFDYQGSRVRLNSVVMVEKTRPLPNVVQTQTKEEKRTSGVGGKAPISE